MNGYDSQRPTDAPQYKRCPECGDLVDWDTMIWLAGKCTCPACYAERRRLLDAREEERE